jgi:hypothetical protein
VGRHIPKQLRHPVFEKVVERSTQHSFVEMLRLDPFSDKTLRRYSLKKLWGQVQPLLDKPESVQNQCLYRLTD